MVSPVNMANRGETMPLRSKVLSRHRCLRPMQTGTGFLMLRISVRTRLHRVQATAVRSSSFLPQDLSQGHEWVHALEELAFKKRGVVITTPLYSCSLLPDENCVHTTVNLRSFLSSPK
jgi:hypothetical protein